jgi:hypothetical protein
MRPGADASPRPGPARGEAPAQPREVCLMRFVSSVTWL